MYLLQGLQRREREERAEEGRAERDRGEGASERCEEKNGRMRDRRRGKGEGGVHM